MGSACTVTRTDEKSLESSQEAPRAPKPRTGILRFGSLTHMTAPPAGGASGTPKRPSLEQPQVTRQQSVSSCRSPASLVQTIAFDEDGDGRLSPRSMVSSSVTSGHGMPMEVQCEIASLQPTMQLTPSNLAALLSNDSGSDGRPTPRHAVLPLLI